MSTAAISASLGAPSAFVRALWGLGIAMHAARNREEGAPHRPRFSESGIWLPEAPPVGAPGSFEEYQLASAAHAAAHLTFGSPPFPVGTLKPLQTAIVSLLEDARVERLAMQRYPGLTRLWAPFHTASANGVKTSGALFARLSRALFDDRFVDGDAWVCKARALFEASRAEWHQPGALRGAGSALGNDLGQMRVQFNAADYVVEPPYRDDHAGLWLPQQPPTASAFEQELDAEAARPSTGTSQRQSARSQAVPPPMAMEPAPERSPPARHELESAPLSPVRYPEWDYVIAQERPEFCSIYEHEAEASDTARLNAALQRYAWTRRSLLSSVRSLAACRSRRQRRLVDGDRLDLQAVVSNCVARTSGARPDPRVYCRVRVERDPPAVLLLLDLSQSLRAPAAGAASSVLVLARDASALLAETLAALSHDLAIHGFDSDSRHDVAYFRFKDFGEPFDDRVRARLAGMSARRSTRLGAALRHAGAALERRAAQRKLLLVVTDGEPSDVDVHDRKYLVQDAKLAALGNRQRGIHGFCLALDREAEPAVKTMFGAGNYLILDQLEALPRRLSQLCVRLSPV